MPTRSFLLGTGANQKFWDISWDEELVVEITSGAVGTRGRARSATFASSAALKQFVVAEIAKTERKGFRERDGVVPAPDTSAENDVAIARLRSQVTALAIDAWVPLISAGNGPGVGSVRGAIHLTDDERWPACPECGAPMLGLLELDLMQLPTERFRDDAFLQLFICEVGETCCVTRGRLARRHARVGAPRVPPHAAPRVITGWIHHEEAPPNLRFTSQQELFSEFDEIDEELAGDLLRSVSQIDDGWQIEDGWSVYDAFVRGLGLAARRGHKLAGFAVSASLEVEKRAGQVLFQIEVTEPFFPNIVGPPRYALFVLAGADGRLDFVWGK